jgi:hypothetical protein
MEAIPNADREWEDWNNLLMALWRATGGDEVGRAAAHAWSAKSGKSWKAEKYDPAAVDERWNHYFDSPPDEIGAGTLFDLASEADPHWRYRYMDSIIAMVDMPGTLEAIFRAKPSGTQQSPSPFEVFWHGKEYDDELVSWLVKDLIFETGIRRETIAGFARHGSNGRGEGGLAGFAFYLAKKHPKAAARLLEKVLPLQVNNSGFNPAPVSTINIVSIESGDYLSKEAIDRLQHQNTHTIDHAPAQLEHHAEPAPQETEPQPEEAQLAELSASIRDLARRVGATLDDS